MRSEEARTARLDGIAPRRAGATRPWLHVQGKGDKQRGLPLPAAAALAIATWLELRDRLPALAEDRLLFPRLGRQRRDGSFPDAGGRLSGRALGEIVRPVMAAAGVPDQLCHPHVLRHTYGTLFMARPDAKLQQLRVLMLEALVADYLTKTAQVGRCPMAPGAWWG